MKRKDSTTRTDDAEKRQKSKEIARERRRQNALERLGSNEPHCIFCGENDWCVLEKHHIAGQAYDDFTGIHCRNCHRKQSDRQKDHPEPTGAPLGLPEAVGRFLLGIRRFLRITHRKTAGIRRSPDRERPSRNGDP